MRKIDTSELPDDLEKYTLVKSRERTFHQKMSKALERTLGHCKELIAEQELLAISLKETAEKEGFVSGFQLFFSQLTVMLDEYGRLQAECFTRYRQALLDTVQSSLHEPVMVEHIIRRLQEKCGHQKVLKIIIPYGIQLPEGTDMSNYQFIDSNNITVQNENYSIRFPAEHLGEMWKGKADLELSSVNEKIEALVPDVLYRIGSELLEMSANKRIYHHE